jgi:predicted transcriptional regulator
MMDILYQRGRATAAEITRLCRAAGLLGGAREASVLEEKGPCAARRRALRYVYLPTMARDTARRSALRHMVSTFFAGSVEETVAALLDISAADLSPKDLDRISNLIEQARKEGEQS